MALIDKDAVKRANRLEDVIPALTGHTVARRNGTRELVTRCPWHDDQHPSLRVNVEKQAWRCDPCNIGGDVFELVQRCRHLTFPEALAWLADRAGLPHGNGHGPTPPARPFVRPEQPEREHTYTDAQGTPTAKVIVGSGSSIQSNVGSSTGFGRERPGVVRFVGCSIPWN